MQCTRVASPPTFERMERRAWTRRQMLSMKKLCSIPSGLGFWGAGWLRAFGGAGWLGLGGAGWLTLSQVALLYRRWHPIVPVYVQAKRSSPCAGGPCAGGPPLELDALSRHRDNATCRWNHTLFSSSNHTSSGKPLGFITRLMMRSLEISFVAFSSVMPGGGRVGYLMQRRYSRPQGLFCNLEELTVRHVLQLRWHFRRWLLSLRRFEPQMRCPMFS